MNNDVPSKDNKKKLKPKKPEKSNSYVLRSHSPVVKSPHPSSNNATKTLNIKSASAPTSPISTKISPVASKCPNCQNIDNLKDYFQDSTSGIDHAISVIKHFLLKFDNKSMDQFFSTSVRDIELIKGNLADLNNYITKIDNIEAILHDSLDSLTLLGNKHNDLLDRLANHEETLKKSSDNYDKSLTLENHRIEEIEKYVHKKLETLESITQSNSKDYMVMEKIGKLEQLCNELNQKVDSSYSNISSLRVPQLDDLEQFINTKIDATKPSTCIDYSPLVSRIDKVEEICHSLHRKLDSNINQPRHALTPNIIPHMPSNATPNTASNIASNVIPHTTPNTKYHRSPNGMPYTTPSTQYTFNSTSEVHITPRDCLILGDSNSKYINIDSNLVKTRRIPTYRIGDINPSLCSGYSRIWVHVGINDLKTRNCRGPSDVHMYHNLLLQKLHQIRLICPNSKIIVSPILPTGVPALNDRARLFTNLLFTGPRWFELLDFRDYCNHECQLVQIYRCYNNPRDHIHLGRIGIDLLRNKLISIISKVDTRSYSAVLQMGRLQKDRKSVV